MTTTNTPAGLVLIVVVVVLVLVRRQRRQTLRQQHGLARNQRVVNIAQQWLDPVFEFLIVGSVLWSDLQHGPLPWLALLIGIIIGLPIGVIRGRFMYVKSLGKGGKIVIERNAAEIGVLLVLIAIKIVAREISNRPTSLINLVAISLLGIGLASSVGRVIYITVQHYTTKQSASDHPSPHS